MERARAGLDRARRHRWADVGRSAHPDAATAGREAARSALAAHGDAGLLLVFASSGYDLRALAAAVGDAAAGVPVVGCSSAAEIDASGPGTRSVVALALGGDGFSFSLSAVSAVEDPRDAGARAAACIGDVADRDHRVLMLVADATAGPHTEVLRGAYSVAGAGVPLVGGAGGVAVHGERPSVIYGGAVLEGAVIGVAIGSDAPLGIGAAHGWRPFGAPMLVTRAAPGRVLELDGRPAADLYRERLGGDQPDDVVLAHPLGMMRRVGEAHVRSVTLDGAADGSIEASVPAGAMVWLMESDVDAVVAAADAACRDALAGLGGEDPAALVLFDCNARLRFLGDRAADEVDCALRHADGATVAGLYTYGEIARTRGSVGFHHQTFVVLAVA